MKWGLFNAIALVLAVLCVGTAVLWAHPPEVYRTGWPQPPAIWSWTLNREKYGPYSYGGVLHEWDFVSFGLIRIPTDDEYGSAVRVREGAHIRLLKGDGSFIFGREEWCSLEWKNPALFWDDTPGQQGYFWGISLSVKALPWVTVVSSIMPLVACRRRLLGVGVSLCTFKRRKAGLCSVCGYDLRATPDRCPECGTVPGNARQKA